MSRLIVLFLAAMTLAGCAGAYVAGDVGPHHENLGDRGAVAAAPTR